MELLEQTASGRVITLDDPQAVPMLWSRDTGRFEAICTGTRPSGEDFRLACHKDGTSLAVGAGGRVTVHLIQ